MRATNGGDWTWKAGAGKVTFERIPDGPAPAESASRRTRQIKELSRRFSAQGRYGPGLKELYELRVLPTAVHTYQDESQGIREGALFVLAEGTNPEAIVAIELIQENGVSYWQYAFNRISSGEIRGRLDDKEVWVSGPSPPFAEQSDEAYMVFLRPM